MIHLNGLFIVQFVNKKTKILIFVSKKTVTLCGIGYFVCAQNIEVESYWDLLFDSNLADSVIFISIHYN